MALRVWLLLIVALTAGCKGCKEEAPLPPPSADPVLRWHLHLGRPAATTSLVATLIHAPLDVRGLVAAMLDVPPGVYEQIDLMQPVDVMQLEAEGTMHRLALYGAAPPPSRKLGSKYKLEPILPGMPGDQRINIDGETRCMLMGNRIACADSPRGMGGMVLFAKRRADTWKEDHTDAVIEASGAALREDLSTAAALTVLTSFTRRLKDATGQVPPALEAYVPKLDPAALFEGVDHAAVRVRMTARGMAIDARVDSPPDAHGPVAEITRATAKAKPMSDAALLLPPDVNVALAYGGATPAPLRQLLHDAIAAPLVGHEQAAALRDQLAALWAATGGAYAVAQRFGELYELHGLRDRPAAEAALAALTSRRLTLDAEHVVTVSSVDGGVVIVIGDAAYALALVGERLVVIAGREVEGALSALRARLDQPKPAPSLAKMADKPLVLSADVGMLYTVERAHVDFTWAYGVPDGTELRAALALEVGGPAVRLVNGILDGSIHATPAEAKAAGNADERGATAK